MIQKKLPDFTELSEFASDSAGGKVMFATDDFFATCENMISDTDPIFIEDKYTEFGKWMDGWETRRKRIPGHDWCIVKLATVCIIRGFLVDTAHFTGNYAPKYSIQAAYLTPAEEELIPKRKPLIGTAARKCEIKHVEGLESDQWDEIVPITALRSGSEETRMNFQKVVSDEAYTHIRVNIYPDGGIARLRVFGEARAPPPSVTDLVDLVSMLYGGICQGFSNAHYGNPKNMIKHKKGESMADGWETARRLDRPEVIEANEDGTMIVTGKEWAVFKLGFGGRLRRICADTSHFKGNFPDSVMIEGVNLNRDDWSVDGEPLNWKTVLKASKLSANKEHWFDCDSDNITHIRVTMAPDGGISRIRTFGYVDTKNIILDS